MRNIKGMSSIVQVTILSALSIVSLFMIFGYLKDLSSSFENQLSPAVDCISQKSEATSACLSQEGKIEVNLNIGLGEKVNYVDLNFKGESFSCGESCGSCTILEQESMKKIYLNAQSPVSINENIAVAINNCFPEILTINSCPL